MPARKLLLFLLILFSFRLSAQVCTELGQNPETAFPVCGSSSFSQTTVPLCVTHNILSPCEQSNPPLRDLNPFWYKFTCFSSGTLGFLITPLNIDDDYDWQLFDVTGHNPIDVFTNKSLFVACNWSGLTGKTGASSAGQSLVDCAGESYPLFSAMPDVIKGHNYLLLMSHFTNTQSGYTLEFKGGTASITDTTPPRLKQARTSCDGRQINVKLNKKMKCSSLSPDGSDFILSPNISSASIVSATGTNCNASFDMDSIVLNVDNILQPGNYTLFVKNGKDNNTLLDICDVAIPTGDSLTFTVFPPQATPFDSLAPVQCAPAELTVVFRDPVLCSSVAADGSDFVLSNTSVSITGATIACNNNGGNIVTLTLSSPIVSSGSYNITLAKGTDGNTIINECLQETPAGQFVNFTTKDTVSAVFDYNIHYGCKADTAFFVYNNPDQVNQWTWKFKNDSSSVQNPVYTFPDFGPQHVQLIVSNGFCTDSSFVDFTLTNELKANFTLPSKLCPQDAATFKDTSIGNIASWKWDFGNGHTSLLKNPPPQLYSPGSRDENYTVRLIVKNDLNCYDTASKPLKVLYTCFIAVPTAFSPNGDGRNDFLYPINIDLAKSFHFRVYNRLGQLVFESTNYANRWDGTFKGVKQPAGTYVWFLEYFLEDTGEKNLTKGTSILMQ